MARPLRMESEAGVYHLINRGNYRSPIFRSEKTKQAFLNCLNEACARTGWIVSAWTIMSNHYHIAVSTPGANLVEGMRWMQGTFAVRFNRFRDERGHVYQGRYKSLIVDPGSGLGPVCHYIHLNPPQAGICPVAELPLYPWTSLYWMHQPSLRPSWYDPRPALLHAGNLTDTVDGRRQYVAYLQWLAENEPEQKKLQFERMSKGWIIGSQDFAKAVLAEHQELVGQGPRLASEMQAARESIWEEKLLEVLRLIQREPTDISAAGKSAEWKVAAAAALKARTTATNRWLSTRLKLGSRFEVGRKVSTWLRHPDPELANRLNLSPRPTA